MPKLAILLSVYNGEQWLTALLDSLSNQSLPFVLIWRDDGSSDASKEIVARYKSLISLEALHSKKGENLGPSVSFSKLIEFALSNTECTHLFFADQDDLWEANKLERMLCEFSDRNLEKPVLAHHDLKVVDRLGGTISASLWNYMRLNLGARELRDFLTRNSVTGCAMAVNRALAELVVPIPPEANMHDWWIAMVASVTGEIRYVHEPLVDYRQHDSNTLGAKRWWSGLNPMTNWRKGWRRGSDEYRSLFSQARAFRAHLRQLKACTGDAESLIEEFISLPSKPVIERLRCANEMGLRRDGFIFWLIGMIRIASTKVN